MDRTELPLEPRHLGVPLSASKTIYMPMVCSMQTVYLSCTDTNTVSKQTKTRFHMTHVSYDFHRVHPKLFMSLWYVQCKPCTYLASRLALSPNGPNKAPPDLKGEEGTLDKTGFNRETTPSNGNILSAHSNTRAHPLTET
jgi:hypothetical protein